MISPFCRYLFTSGAFGAVGGAFHGHTIGTLELFRDTGSLRPYTRQHAYEYLVKPMARDGAYGALLGPWLPIWIPFSLTLWRDRAACPQFNRRPE